MEVGLTRPLVAACALLALTLSACGGDKQPVYEAGAYAACISARAQDVEGLSDALRQAAPTNKPADVTIRNLAYGLEYQAPAARAAVLPSGEFIIFYVAASTGLAERAAVWIEGEINTTTPYIEMERSGNLLTLVDRHVSQGTADLLATCRATAERT